jgi:hypothetical protein
MKKLLSRSRYRIANALIEIFDFCQSNNDFHELIPAQRFVVVVFELHFFKVDCNKGSVDILRCEILVDDLPGPLTATGKFEPTHHWVRDRIGDQRRELVLNVGEIDFEYFTHVLQVRLILNELGYLQELPIDIKPFLQRGWPVQLKGTKDTCWSMKFSNNSDLLNLLKIDLHPLDVQMLFIQVRSYQLWYSDVIDALDIWMFDYDLILITALVSFSSVFVITARQICCCNVCFITDFAKDFVLYFFLGFRYQPLN